MFADFICHTYAWYVAPSYISLKFRKMKTLVAPWECSSWLIDFTWEQPIGQHWSGWASEFAFGASTYFACAARAARHPCAWGCWGGSTLLQRPATLTTAPPAASAKPVHHCSILLTRGLEAAASAKNLTHCVVGRLVQLADAGSYWWWGKQPPVKLAHHAPGTRAKVARRPRRPPPPPPQRSSSRHVRSKSPGNNIIAFLLYSSYNKSIFVCLKKNTSMFFNY